MGGYYEPYDNSIDQDLCKKHEGFYYYRVYDLEGDMLLDEWHLQENCELVYVDGWTYMVKRRNEYDNE